MLAISAVAAGWFWTRQPDADSLTGQAYDAVVRGDFDSARVALVKLHELNPDDAAVVESLADVCLSAGDEAAAISWLSRVPDSSPQKAIAAAFRGAQLAMQSQRGTDARLCLDRCLQLDPDHQSARRLLIHLELILTRWESMFAHIAELDRRGQATPADVALLCVGRNYYWEDNSHLEWLEGCVRSSPHDCLARTALAYFHSLDRRQDEALALLNSSDTSQDDFESWRINLGIAEHHIDEGRFSDAQQELSRMPADADAVLRTWLAHARIFTEQDEIEQAIIAYDNASRLSPFDPEPVAAMSRLLTRQGRHDDASQWAQRAHLNSQLWQILSHAKPLAPQGPSASTVMDVGRLLLQLGRHREAIICFDSLLDHHVFGVEATQLTTRANESDGQPRYLTVADVSDLTRSSSITGTQHELVPSATTRTDPGDAESGTTIELRDIAPAVGLDFTFFRGDAGVDFLPETLGGGIGVIDFDMDGWADLFLTQGTSLPVKPQTMHFNRLFRNVRAISAVDVTSETGVAHGGYGQGCAAADMNNDGFPDLFVCNHGENILYRNNGDGTFSDITRDAGLHGQQWSTSASFADFDRDGDVDLYSVNYVHMPEEDMKSCRTGNYVGPCRVMDHPAEQDTFWLNLGDGTFQDQTDAAGIQAENGKGLGVVSADFDNDGWIDLFVGNDTTGNFLFRNLGTGTETAHGSGARNNWSGFQEMGLLAGVAFNRDGKAEACMGIACEDQNQDGLFDLFITNYEHETNTFYTNLGDLSFADQTHHLRLAEASRPMLGWGTQFIDLDADRERDLFVTNGHLYEPPMRSQLFSNHSGLFTEVSDRAGQFFQAEKFGRSAAVIDWNGDLAADLTVSFLKSPVALLQNNTSGGNRLSVRLIGVDSPRDVQDARIAVTAGGRVTHFRSSSDGGYFASNEKDVMIGLGNDKQVEILEVRWSSGTVQTFHHLPAGRKYALVEHRQTPYVLSSTVDDIHQ